MTHSKFLAGLSACLFAVSVWGADGVGIKATPWTTTTNPAAALAALGGTSQGGTATNAQPPSAVLTNLSSKIGSDLTNLSLAAITNTLGYRPATNGAVQPASAALTNLANGIGSGLTNLASTALAGTNGLAGQILTSTGTSLVWSNATGGTGGSATNAQPPSAVLTNLASGIGSDLTNLSKLAVNGAVKYTPVLDPLSYGLLAYYPFHEGAGTNASDLSQYQDTATFTGANSWVPGVFGSGVQVSAYATTLKMASVAQFNGLTNVSVGCWVKYTTSSGSESEVVALDNFYLSLTSSNQITFWVLTNVAGAATLTVTVPSMNDGQFHQLTGTYDGATSKVYLDGQLKGSLAVTGAVYSAAANGYVGYIGAWSGAVDEVKIWNRALSASEVAFNSQAPATVNNTWGSLMLTNMQAVTLGSPGAYAALTNFNLAFTNGFNANLGTGGLTNLIAGYYRINLSCSFSNATGTDVFEGEIFVDGNQRDEVGFQVQSSSNNGWGCGSANGVLNLPAGSGLTFRIRNNTAARNAFVGRCSMTVGSP